jgi:predicted nucleotidyltransferase
MTGCQQAILKTLAYADVFSYPLTAKEIHLFLIGQKTNQTDLAKELKGLKNVSQKRGFFYLKNQEKIFFLRQKRKKYSQEKLKIARKVTGWLKLVPWIKMVGITGNLAMNNADMDDDIDLLIVTTKDRLWLSRLSAILIAELLRVRRRPGQKSVANKICLNMFLDEVHLKIPQKEQNLLTAHEICQLRPFFSKDNFYQKFIQQNQWSQKFLPNWKP